MAHLHATHRVRAATNISAPTKTFSSLDVVTQTKSPSIF
ncbi:hypothetical protein SNOG_11495 [Parastagonospora nodorum SN15]|uniref:Uncharacterized protein n=1 Tax=Phaeosphaeria nodorum (strain SN15 / ATCC MYA-4574 / FGSC 10173) TaxID=321614 RepID=Q0U9R9_PHANO|nr:hypothetical protein SNOG_11495 [Parastagonospora nodorum SN15]EAT81203.1 hypothetical protein SNOG_11495 [Parastagonospora nodorum SN15]